MSFLLACSSVKIPMECFSSSPRTEQRPHQISVARFPSSASSGSGGMRKIPILLFDIMDTVVRDPFYHDVPEFFGMNLEELICCKHPTAWIEFENGLIDEAEFARKFFRDGRTFDVEGLKSCMRRGYKYVEGVEKLLWDLKENGYEIHAFTNYPVWYKMIDDKLNLSSYLSWTFCSCITGKRKPNLDAYLRVLELLEVEPSCCIFVDDRLINVEAGAYAGMTSLHFRDVVAMRKNLLQLGVSISHNAHC